MQDLLQRGGNVNQTANNGATPVALADSNGHHEVVKYLIEKAGADANMAQINGFTPLVPAARLFVWTMSATARGDETPS